eukprot:TRINITY_DN16813_c0_g1_i2.p1 TRINITY_DN16813_c0_g1~~TRINITY_DN16813_c0_g1_i2.p1  ORF type:complete len:329 (-),score=48.60 TRINITY_DN16813_c0_g1_i2:3-989(-)
MMLAMVLGGLVVTVLLVLGVLRFRRSQPVNLSDRVVLVTGGASGLGLALAHEFLRRGAKVCVWDINGIESARAQLVEAWGEKSVTVERVDVTNKHEVPGAAAKIKERFGTAVGILVNNAGVMAGGSIIDCDPYEVERTVKVNLLAQFSTIQAMLPEMLQQQFGHIVTVSSIMAYQGVANCAAYCASKAGSLSLGESLREELRRRGGVQGCGVGCTVVCPTLIQTPMFEGIGQSALAKLIAGPALSVENVAWHVVQAVVDRRQMVVLNSRASVGAILRALPVLACDHRGKWLCQVWLSQVAIDLVGASHSMDPLLKLQKVSNSTAKKQH